MMATTVARDRIDLDDLGCVDDVALNGVEMFRLEHMSDNCVWICLYRKGKPDVVFWLNSAGRIHTTQGEAPPTT